MEKDAMSGNMKTIDVQECRMGGPKKMIEGDTGKKAWKSMKASLKSLSFTIYAL